MSVICHSPAAPSSSFQEQEYEEEQTNRDIAISLWARLSDSQQDLLVGACLERRVKSFGHELDATYEDYPFEWFFEEDEDEEDYDRWFTEKLNAQFEMISIMMRMVDGVHVDCNRTALITDAYHLNFCESTKEPFWPRDEGLYCSEYRDFANAWLTRYMELPPDFTEETLPKLFWKEKRMPEFWRTCMANVRPEERLKRQRLSPEEARRQGLCNEVEVMNMEARVSPESQVRWREILNELSETF